jgi:hypothetical protein
MLVTDNVQEVLIILVIEDDVYRTIQLVELANSGMAILVDIIRDSVEEVLIGIQVIEVVDKDQITQLVAVAIDMTTVRQDVLEEAFMQEELVEMVDIHQDKIGV